MLGGDAVDERQRIVELVDQDDRAEIAPARRGRLGARQRLQLPLDRRLDGARRSRRRR